MKKVLGLILELNPPHNGHKYFIDEAKKKVNPDITIAVVSSSFMMRGDVMVIDKFTKTKLMQELGIDIILELPVISLLNSADLFAYNAISILNNFKITDIAFGSEEDNIDILYQALDIMNSSNYDFLMNKYLSLGYSYSTSSLKAIKELSLNSTLSELISLPNNTLAIQYLKSLSKINPKVKIHLVKRISNNYYDEIPSSSIASATSIRNEIKEHNNISNYIPKFHLPIDFIDIDETYNNLFNLIKYKFYSTNLDSLSNVYSVSEGIQNRIYNFLDKANNYFELIDLVKTKRYNPNKIKRILLAILLDIPKAYENVPTFYLRILGINDKGLIHVRNLDKETKAKIITNLKNNNDEFVLIELKATRLYEIITNKKIYQQEFMVPFKEKKDDN